MTRLADEVPLQVRWHLVASVIAQVPASPVHEAKSLAGPPRPGEKAFHLTPVGLRLQRLALSNMGAALT
jgi:hypothetical protein